MLRARLVVPSLLALAASHGCAREASAFVSVPLADALTRAGAEHKVVFLEFGAEWCAPCKRMKATTLVDPRVVSWLGEHTIALQVDLDESPALAKEFAVASVPTMVFVRPDRSVLGTITGYRDAETFLVEAARRLQGTTALADATAKAEASPKDLGARLELFRELSLAGKHAEALAEAEHYWKASRGTSHAGVRASFFLSDMKQLAQQHAPAGALLQRWFDEARDESAGKKGQNPAAMDLVALAKALDKKQEVLDLVDQRNDHGLVQVLGMFWPEVLLDARKYRALVDSGFCKPGSVKSRVGMMKMATQRVAKGDPEAEAAVRDRMVESVVLPFEALAGTSSDDDALEVAALVLGGGDDATVRSRLAAAAERAGNVALAKRVRERR
jgi:thioredoxin-related protein